MDYSVADGLQRPDDLHWFAVYNQDNRYKVAEDEAKARKKGASEKKRQDDGRRQARRNLLVKRAGGQVGIVEFRAQAPNVTSSYISTNLHQALLLVDLPIELSRYLCVVSSV